MLKILGRLSCLFGWLVFLMQFAECESSFWCCNQSGYQATTEAKGKEEETTARMSTVCTSFCSFASLPLLFFCILTPLCRTYSFLIVFHLAFGFSFSLCSFNSEYSIVFYLTIPAHFPRHNLSVTRNCRNVLCGRKLVCLKWKCYRKFCCDGVPPWSSCFMSIRL